MQNATLQMGVEVEMHGINFSFRCTEVGHTDDFWPMPPMGTDVDTTMMAHDPILVPQSFANNAAAQSTDTLAWGGTWGFMVCGDAYGSNTDTIQGAGAAITFGVCTAFELNTAAHEIRDADYWVVSRAAVRLFKEALLEFAFNAAPTPPNGILIFNNHERWYSIDDLIACYNAKIDNLWLANGWLPGGVPNVQDWRLKKSYHLDQFEAQALPGNYKNVTSNWHGHFVLRRWGPNNTYEINSDAQVNYQVDLEYLWDETDAWLELWAHIWMHDVNTAGGRVSPDPVSPHHASAGLTYVYRNQINAALWRMGREMAEDVMGHLMNIPALNLTVLPPQIVTQLKALLMMMLAMGAIEPGPAAHGGTQKNAYSQFPKTSPASVVGELGTVMQRTWVRRLGSDETHLELGGLAISAYAYSKVDTYRGMQRQNLQDYLPRGGPYRGGTDYVDPASLNDALLTRLLPALPFVQMWRGSFSTAAQNAGNKYGYDVNAPFYCYWGLAHTAQAAVKDALSGRIKILFESRFGHNRLNLGFHPDATEETFYEAYKSLFMLTVPTKPERTTALDVVKDFSSSRSRSQHRSALDKGQKRGMH